MGEDRRRFELHRIHKRWADRHLLFWITFIISIFVSVHLLLSYLLVSKETQISCYVLLATIVLTGVIWKAAGAIVARTHLLIRNSEIT